jgi:MFS superfamily sulfate permease-like transporter
VLQGYNVTGSLSKSAASEAAGSKTPLTLVVVSAMTLLTILLIAGVFEYLPEATLAAIVIAAVVGMIDVRKLRRLWDAHVVDFWLAVGALAGVVVLGILQGILVGVVLSLVLFIHRLDHPHVARLGRSREREEFGDLDEHPQFTDIPGVLMLRFDAPLIFANADAFTDAIENAVDGAQERDGIPPQAVVIDLETCFEIDVTGVDALLRVAKTLEQQNIELHLARAKAPVRAVLEHTGAAITITADHLHATVASAVDAAERTS